MGRSDDAGAFACGAINLTLVALVINIEPVVNYWDNPQLFPCRAQPRSLIGCLRADNDTIMYCWLSLQVLGDVFFGADEADTMYAIFG